MSKIIVKGNKHLEPVYVYEVSCEKCGSVIQLEDKEMHYTFDQHDRDEWWDWKCPVCGKYHQIDTRNELKMLKINNNDKN